MTKAERNHMDAIEEHVRALARQCYGEWIGQQRNHLPSKGFRHR
jgi:hypothetical protein